MAKKQSADATEAPKTETAPAAGDTPAEKGKGKDKEGKPAKEPKAKEGKAKTSPAAPTAEAPATPAAEGTSPAAPAPAAQAPAVGESTKKKGRRPGITPARGKKLRNHLKNQRQKLGKEGPTTVKRAIGLLK